MRLLPLAAALLLAACTSAQIQTTDVKAPTEKFTSVVVGEIGSAKPEHTSYALFFRTALIQQLQAEQPPLTVVTEAAATPPPGAFKLSGQITEVDFGNTAARIIIGFGAGSQQIKGNFAFAGANGEPLASFSSSESYAGGAGIGGASLLSIEELAGRFGKSTGQAAARWARGEPLKAPTSEPEPDSRR